MNNTNERSKNMSMIGRISFITMFAIVILITGCNSQQEEEIAQMNKPSQQALKAEKIPEALMNEQYTEVYRQFTPQFQQRVSEKQIETLSQSFFESNDSYEIVSEFSLQGADHYIWLDQSGEKVVSAIVDQESSEILGLQIRNIETYPETDEQFTKNEYIVPFKDTWFTYWGGNNELLNYHYTYDTHRYAYDFVVVKNDSTYIGDPKANESYYAFGKEVVAPADGIILEVVNDVEDNEPVGVMNENEPAGNYVIIDHGGEYSLLAHFKKGSIIVEKGQQIKQGDVLGLCGNSGNSSEAHIHFQVSEKPTLELGKSIRIKFKNDLNPIRGQFIDAQLPSE